MGSVPTYAVDTFLTALNYFHTQHNIFILCDQKEIRNEKCEGKRVNKSNVILKKFEILKIQIFVNLFSTTQRVFQKLILKKKKKKKERKKREKTRKPTKVDPLCTNWIEA